MYHYIRLNHSAADLVELQSKPQMVFYSPLLNVLFSDSRIYLYWIKIGISCMCRLLMAMGVVRVI